MGTRHTVMPLWPVSRGLGVVDNVISPLSNTPLNAGPDLLVKWSFTYETGTFVDVSFRRTDATHRISIQATGTHLVVYKDDAGLGVIGISAGVFTDGVKYDLEAVFNGSSIKVSLDTVLKHNLTEVFNQTVPSGEIIHNLATNDIVLTSYNLA